MVKRCCTKDCPERRPACSDYCEKYKAWKKELAKERLHTKNETYAGSIHKNDFDEEFWIGKRRR